MVVVTDYGNGLSEEDKAHLFEPFHATKGHDTGLGLLRARVRDTLDRTRAD